MPLLPVPALVRCADDLLPAARTLLDDAATRFEGDPCVGVTCRPGCTACCSHAVSVTAAEVRSIVAALDRFDAHHRAQIDRRIDEASAVLTAAGVEATAFAGDAVARRATARRYFSLGLACPLLDDGLCSVYADRPIACRAYLASSDPNHCAELDIHPERVVIIRASSDVNAGFQDVSAEFGEPDRTILVIALAEARAARGAAAPPDAERRSGPAMAAMLTPSRR